MKVLILIVFSLVLYCSEPILFLLRMPFPHIFDLFEKLIYFFASLRTNLTKLNINLRGYPKLLSTKRYISIYLIIWLIHMLYFLFLNVCRSFELKELHQVTN